MNIIFLHASLPELQTIINISESNYLIKINNTLSEALALIDHYLNADYGVSPLTPERFFF